MPHFHYEPALSSSARQALPNQCHSAGTCLSSFPSPLMVLPSFPFAHGFPAHLFQSVVLPEGDLSSPLPRHQTQLTGLSAALQWLREGRAPPHPSLSVSTPFRQLVQLAITTSYPFCLLSVMFPVPELFLTQVESNDLFLWMGFVSSFVYSYLSCPCTSRAWHKS